MKHKTKVKENLKESGTLTADQIKGIKIEVKPVDLTPPETAVSSQLSAILIWREN